jgi:predicted RNase H-like HicB family nuclease
MKFIVTFAPDEDGGYIVECPALPGCISHGMSIEDAKANIADAISASLATRRDLSLPLYVETAEVEVGV